MVAEWLEQNLWLVLILTLWEFAWKGWSLWLAARNNSKSWFVLLMIVNTAGILPMFYIFIENKKRPN